MKKAILAIILMALTSCAHYSTTGDRSEPENIINAPIDKVWEAILNILPTERMKIKTSNKSEYYILARKEITFWSTGDNVSIKLFPKNENRTIVHFQADAEMQWVGWGHQERMVKDIFEKIKKASEL